MKKLSTTKLSSKGQVVIPEDIRKALNLESGDQFVVIATDNVVILKSIEPPRLEEFSSLLDDAHEKAMEARLTKDDLNQAIKHSRKKKRKQ